MVNRTVSGHCAKRPIAELHCHIEGAAPPELVLAQAAKYGTDVSAVIRDGAYVWRDFADFLKCYEAAASVFRTPEDYALLAETYLASIAADGAIYGEFFVSPVPPFNAGLAPEAYLEGTIAGLQAAKAKHGIEARLILTGIRHAGADAVEAAARFAVRHKSHWLTGFGMAGEERMHRQADFTRAFDIARDGGLGITVHAGEWRGPDEVREALDALRPARIGHGVRAIEDADLVRRLADERIVLECCPGSNVALGVFPDFASHPYPALRAAGVRVTLNSDDPPYFWTSLKREYGIARAHFGMEDAALLADTRTAIEAAFVDEPTRAALLARIDQHVVGEA
ncbi:MAG: adenosine deaminase [Rhizobiaceae bacterium]|nr:adenosine deaminase [Rhizobiaceae bacterium]